MDGPIDMGGGGDGEEFAGVEIGTGRAEWGAGGETRSRFVDKILYLLKVVGVLRFPVNPNLHLSDAAKHNVLREGDVIPCHENVCAKCNREYIIKDKQQVLAVTQVSISRTTSSKAEHISWGHNVHDGSRARRGNACCLNTCVF